MKKIRAVVLMAVIALVLQERCRRRTQRAAIQPIVVLPATGASRRLGS